MAKDNKMEVQIGIKTKDSPIEKLKQKLKGVAQTSEKTEQKLGKMTDKVKTTPIEKLKNKLIAVPPTVSKLKDKFSQLKGKINDSFPVRASNYLKERMKALRGETNKTGGAFDFLKGKIGKLVGIAAGILSIGTAISFVNSSIEDYKADMTNATKLKSNIQIVQAYKNDKGTMDKVFNEFQAEASRIQGIGVFGDEMMVGAQAQLSTFQLTNKEINMLMPKIADIVANQKGLNGTAEDFFGTANMIGKAMSTGMLAPLRKVGIALTDAEMQQFKTLNQTQRAAKLQEILSKNVGNVNEELAKTPLGKIQNAQNAWGDMKEKIGEAAVMVKGRFAPYLVAAIPIVQELGTKIIDGIGKGIDYLQFNSGKIGTVIKSMFSDVDFSFFINSFKEMGSIILEAFKGINVNSIILAIKSIITSLSEVYKFMLNLFKPIISVVAPIFAFVINQIAKFIPKIMPIFTGIMKLVGVISLIGAAFLLIGNPITWIIGLGIGFITLINNWGTVVNTVMNFISGVITAIWTGISSFFNSIWSGIAARVNFTINLIQGYIQLAKTKTDEVLNGITTAFTSGFDKAKEIVKGAIETIKGFFGGLLSKAKEVGGQIGNALNPLNAANKIKNVLTGKNKIPENYNGARSWRGGLTTVAEKGAEMIKIPNQKPFVAGYEMLMNLPQGTEISTAEATERAVNQFGGIDNSTSNTANKTSISNNKNSNDNKKFVFSPKIVVYNNGNDDDIDNRIVSVLNRWFEEKYINMGG